MNQWEPLCGCFPLKHRRIGQSERRKRNFSRRVSVHLAEMSMIALWNLWCHRPRPRSTRRDGTCPLSELRRCLRAKGSARDSLSRLCSKPIRQASTAISKHSIIEIRGSINGSASLPSQPTKNRSQARRTLSCAGGQESQRSTPSQLGLCFRQNEGAPRNRRPACGKVRYREQRFNTAPRPGRTIQ
jgi:hypothetical protein